MSVLKNSGRMSHLSGRIGVNVDVVQTFITPEELLPQRGKMKLKLVRKRNAILSLGFVVSRCAKGEGKFVAERAESRMAVQWKSARSSASSEGGMGILRGAGRKCIGIERIYSCDPLFFATIR